jgi:SAM-dependent methyltransferase
MTGKLTSDQARQLWRRIHDDTADPLAAVCFPDKSRRLNRFFDRIQRDALGRALRAVGFRPAGAMVLDVGCGRGRWLRFYESLGARASGVDVSATAVEACVEDGLSARVGDITNLPEAAGTFDLVSSVTVLLHLPPADQRAAARELERVARDGGLIVLLEATGRDRSPHVWPRSVRRWIDLFANSDPVWAEGHYYVPLIRALWRAAPGRTPRRLLRRLEDVAVTVSLPLELLLMRGHRGRGGRAGLQHVIALRKRTTSASV